MGGAVRSGPGAARTILLFHTISARPLKQPRMVRTFHRYTRGLGWRMHCGAEVTESSANKQHHLLPPRETGRDHWDRLGEIIGTAGDLGGAEPGRGHVGKVSVVVYLLQSHYGK